MANNDGLENCATQAVRSAHCEQLVQKLQDSCQAGAAGVLSAVSKARDGCDLEMKGLLPAIGLDGFKTDDLGKELIEGKNVCALIKGLLHDNPDMVLKAAEALPDGSYPIGTWIAKAESTGLVKLDAKDAELVNDLQTLTKQGDHFDITLKSPLVETTPGGEIDLNRNISFDVVRGDVPMINNIHGISHPLPIGSVDLDAVRASKNSQGSYDYEVHTPGVRLWPLPIHVGDGWKPA